MSKRIVNHSNNFTFNKIISKSNVKGGDIIKFNYQKDVHNRRPLLLVMKSGGGEIQGFNLNYLKEYLVKKLLQEWDTGSRDFKNYSMFEKAYRTYKTSKIGVVKIGEYQRGEGKRFED